MAAREPVRVTVAVPLPDAVTPVVSAREIVPELTFNVTV